MKVPFIREELDHIQFHHKNMDWETLNEYEVLYVYCISGANRPLLGKVQASDIPIYLREKGVTKPKIMWQMDYFQPELKPWNFKYIMPFIDCIIDASTYWQGKSKPQYYVAYPLTIKENKFRWYNFDEKEDYIVGLKRHYGYPHPSVNIAKKIGLEYKILGFNVSKRYELDYTETLARAKIALDYHTRGVTWSRFGAETTLLGTPILGPPEYASIHIANPEFAIPYKVGEEEPNSLILERCRKLLTDKDYYTECQELAKKNIENHLNPEVCSERYRSILRLLGIDI
jgi:hypothetical protein